MPLIVILSTVSSFRVNVKKKDKKFWSKQELLIFLEATKNHPNPVVYPLFRVLAFCGIHKGEALALSWKDVDIKNKQIKIHRNVSRTKNRQIITTTKTNTSRLISIDDETLNVLLDIKGDNDLVFHQVNGKPSIHRRRTYGWIEFVTHSILNGSVFTVYVIHMLLYCLKLVHQSKKCSIA